MDDEVKATYQAPEIIAGHHTWLKAHVGDLSVSLDSLPAKGSGAALISRPSDPVVSKYKDGSQLLKYDWDLLIRVPASDTKKKLDASGLIDKVRLALESGDTPDLGAATIWKAGQVTNTAQMHAEDGGADLYVATFRTIYKV